MRRAFLSTTGSVRSFAFLFLNIKALTLFYQTYNTQMKSPCEVASILLSECNNGRQYHPLVMFFGSSIHHSLAFPVDTLPQSSHYVGPSIQNANPCQCNTVTYSLMSACGACQGRTYLS
jgi:hypothetical protein